MTASADRPLRGRQAQARRNDDRVLQAAREVFAEQGPGASMADIARRAGVGVASLYARYENKAELVREISAQGMTTIIEAAQLAVQEPDAWQGFVTFMHTCAEAGAGGLMQLAGAFEPTDQHKARAHELHDALQALVRHTKQHGPLRPEISPADIYLLLANLRIQYPPPDRAPQLRRRHLALLLAGLRATDDAPLPGPPSTWRDLERHWNITEP